MAGKPTKPHHQAETEFTGERQEFSGTVLDPNDPNLEPRIRRGRPVDSKPESAKKKDGRNRE